MTTYRFVCEIHEEFGAKGWRMENETDADPATGRGVAHDILEHSHSKAADFGVVGELVALGTILWLRGETGELDNSHHDFSTNMGVEFRDIFEHHINEDYPFPEPPKTRRLNRDTEQEIQQIIEYARKDILNECVEWSPDRVNSLLAMSIGYLRIGYRAALRRYQYRGLDNYTMAYLFKDIQRCADLKLNHAQIGDVMHIKVNLKHKTICAEVIGYDY